MFVAGPVDADGRHQDMIADMQPVDLDHQQVEPREVSRQPSFSFAVLSATNRRDTEDFVVARLAWPARSPTGSRTERAYLRVATPVSIWFNAQRDRRSAFWIAVKLGSSSSAPPR